MTPTGIDTDGIAEPVQPRGYLSHFNIWVINYFPTRRLGNLNSSPKHLIALTHIILQNIRWQSFVILIKRKKIGRNHTGVISCTVAQLPCYLSHGTCWGCTKLYINLMKYNTHSSTTRNLSPSDPRQRPLLLNRGPSIRMGWRTPDWNHVPSQRSGK